MMWSHTRGDKSQKHVVQESNVLFLSSEHFILTQRHGENCNNSQKTTFAAYKSSSSKKKKRRLSLKSVTVLYLQYTRAQLMDEDCLATPDPTTSMFLFWINTNRMGTAKKAIFAMFLY